MWFRFTRAYDFKPEARNGHVTVAYKPGVHNVTRECASKAEAAGAGQPVKVKKGKEDDGAEA